MAQTPCSIAPAGTLNCTGDQSNGVSAVSPVTTLNVHSLTQPISNQPFAGWGIRLVNEAGQTLTVNSGFSFSPVTINPASGFGIGGVSVFSKGSQGPDGDDACNLCTGFGDLEGRSSTNGGTGGAGGTTFINAFGSIAAHQPDALGIFAFSVGGNGGQGGDSATGRNSKAGGQGGIGGAITINGLGSITTHGARGVGILVISEGGNGGGGGSGSTFNSADDGGPGGQGGTISVLGNFNITTYGSTAYGIWGKALGGIAGGGGDGGWTGTGAGSGGTGSAGGHVNINTLGLITTSGSDAYGIYAESIGGFGGSGGSGTSIFHSAGGSGASAGSGGNVVVTSANAIFTSGARAHGIFGQSVGGGGGTGGSGGGAISSLGGSGSTGGDGGTVTVSSSAVITTTGPDARGIYAQSIGGGGGDGGSSAGISAIGGSGSTTSDGGVVNVLNTGTVTSTDSAIFAQSIGGGGGNGGSSSGWFSFGGSGGSGGDGGRVTVSSHGDLSTSENNANGIFAQSLGGGGGNGGNSTAVGAFVAVAVGGEGAAGGTGANVAVGVNPFSFVVDPVTGSILTTGKNANGIQAQSVGGGGGNGGFAVSVAAGIGGAAALGLGGRGGGGNDAGNAAVYFGNSSSQILTTGENSNGIFAQSVGGGGGSGGFSIAGAVSNGFTAAISLGGTGGTGGDAGVVTVGRIANPLSGNILTTGAHSYGLLAQSVGGGGGNGGMAIGGTASVRGVSFAMGGAGAGGGNGSAVDVVNGAFTNTFGADSHGLFAQSLGGGGGSGGFSVAAGVSSSGSINVGLGGSAGPGGNAGTVSLRNTGSIITARDHSYGILSQSIGGGGGDGGFAIAGGISGGTTASFGIGGSGGAGGFSQAVNVSNSGSILTQGPLSHGLFAQSVGGGGGSGGFGIAGSVSTSSQLNFAMGGSGGSAGAAGTVTVANTGDITTGGTAGTGKGSYGISAQSIGGGGGTGGFSGSFSALFGGSGTAVSVSVGGDGGGGGNSDAVSVTNSGILSTSALGSIGLFAQSIGGGGGDAGFGLAFALSAAQSGKAASLSIGGDGGVGGNGSHVFVSNSRLIQTLADKSQGILAQSIGGGGGNGGFSISTAGGTGDEAKSIAVGIGGKGGIAGDGRAVNVTNTAQIVTMGDDSSAIHAQSIGGGGGTGGFSFSGSLAGTSGKTVSVSIGGGGGAGGRSDQVNVFGSGSNAITTAGDRSHGIEAQSVGGGGGDGGFSIAAALGFGGNDPNKPSTTISLSVGGGGGDGNFSGAVNVGTAASNLVGDITTNGQESIGILAQSIGGGGGNGGFSVAGSINLAAGQEGPNKNLAISVGGGGGIGNHAGAVGINHRGSITTDGDGSHGIEAQSIGGGGGNGGSARAIALQLGPAPTDEQKNAGKKNMALSVALGGNGAGAGNGGAVTVNHVGNILTDGGAAYGIFAQSIGGGGGHGGDGHQGFEGQFLLRKFDRSKFGKSGKFVMGGSGGASGDGSSVFVSNTGTITTYGDGSSAVLAQSIGAGGGAGGNGDLELGLSLWTAGIGGAAGSTGDGRDVTVNINGNINTFGVAAQGIFAQSIGGGGGAGGSVERGLKNYLNVGLGIGYGRGGGNGGDGGTVNVNSTADIYTQGIGSSGIFAQSIGGGGGVVGSTGNDVPLLSVLNFAGSVGGTGSGGVVNVMQAGSITTLGDAADGIFAQSAGGTELGGAVNITLNSGNIIAQGLESNGIFAQSVGTGGSANITVNINGASSIVQGGTNTGAAVRFADGHDNTLTNRGMLTTFSGLAGTTFIGTTGNDTINNYGLFVGSLDAGTGTNTFNNLSDAVFGVGTSVNLGTSAGSYFNNAGRLSFGNYNDMQTTNVTGNFGQSGTPNWLVDIGEVGVSDRLAVSGRGQLGTSVTTVDLFELTLPTTTGAYTLLTAAQGGLLGAQFGFGTLFGAMPLGTTFAFANTDTTEQLTLLPSTGAFHWAGANSSSWITPFVNGRSNWTRSGGTDYVFGTPGAGSDLVFSATGLTTMGADFSINSLTFTGTGAPGVSHTLAAGNTLTIVGGGGRGLTVAAGSMPSTLGVNVVLAGDQTWLNNGAGLLAVNGQTITGSGRNLTVDGSGVTNISAAIQTGGGSLTKAGNGLLILSGANTYGGGTTVAGGTLLGNSTTLQGAFLNNALVTFDQEAAGTFAGNMSGSGMLLKQNSGLLILTGANTYTGGTIVAGGTLQVNTTSLPGNVLNQTALIFDQAQAGTYAGSITGAGTLTKRGSGALILTGNSSQFAGNTAVTEGQLFVNGSLGGGSLVLQRGTLLGGTGFVPTTTIQGGAVLAPGNAIGTLIVVGDLGFDGGSSYRVETEAYGFSDRTLVTGTVTPVGAIVDVQAVGTRRYRPINKYTISTANAGVSGTFAGVTSSLGYLNPSLQYDPNNVYLTLRRNDVDFRSNGTEGNQTEVAIVLNQLVSTATDALADVVNNVYDLSSGDALRAMSSMSGIIYQHVARNGLDSARMFTEANMRRLELVAGATGRSLGSTGLALNSLQTAAAGPNANTRYGLWLSGLGGVSKYRGNAADAGARVPTRGMIFGFDAALGDKLTVGVSGGQASPDVTLDAADDRSTARMAEFGVYTRFAHNGSRLDAVVGGAGYDNHTFRTVTDGTAISAMSADYRARSLSAQVEYGRAFNIGTGLILEPQAGLQFGSVRLDGFNEQGDSVLALILPDRTVRSQRLMTGTKMGKAFLAGGTKMMIEGRAAWAHDFKDIDSVAVRFQGDPFTTGFNLAALEQSRNGAVLGAGFVGDARGSLKFFADFHSEISGAAKGWSGNAGLHKAW